MTAPDYFSKLRCPLTGEALHFNNETGCLESPAAGLAFPVRDGIPILLPSEASPLTPAELPGTTD